MLARFLPRPSGARRFGWVDDEVGRPKLMRTKVLGCSVCKQEAGGLAVEAVFIG